MDDYQFISSVIGSLAWPFFIFLTFLLFRQQIVQLLPLLKFKYKDLDVSFRLDQAEKEAQGLPPSNGPVAAPTPEELDKFRKLAELSPNSAIVDKAREVEQALEMYAEASGITATSGNRLRSWLDWTRELRKHELIAPSTSALLDDLRSIRNAAVHGRNADITIDDAVRFGTLADILVQSLQMSTLAAMNARNRPPPDPDQLAP
jgi:hypothetical protein